MFHVACFTLLLQNQKLCHDCYGHVIYYHTMSAGINTINTRIEVKAFKLKVDAVISSGSTSAICLLTSFEASYAVARWQTRLAL